MAYKDVLIDGLRKDDGEIGELRALIDGHARGRRYREVAAVAERLAKLAKEAAAKSEALDKILTAEWEQRRRA